MLVSEKFRREPEKFPDEIAQAICSFFCISSSETRTAKTRRLSRRPSLSPGMVGSFHSLFYSYLPPQHRDSL